ncbi:MAG: hypothetical protein Q8900_00965 [Bacillota bacterium]|nr:hypothetical protein [Bacillota bacterium]
MEVDNKSIEYHPLFCAALMEYFKGLWGHENYSNKKGNRAA